MLGWGLMTWAPQGWGGSDSPLPAPRLFYPHQTGQRRFPGTLAGSLFLQANLGTDRAGVSCAGPVREWSR